MLIASNLLLVPETLFSEPELAQIFRFVTKPWCCKKKKKKRVTLAIRTFRLSCLAKSYCHCILKLSCSFDSKPTSASSKTLSRRLGQDLSQSKGKEICKSYLTIESVSFYVSFCAMVPKNRHLLSLARTCCVLIAT